ncbi:hypothetical protein GQR58_023186 [Nymphon striatum]|nr:hypothetical protein GQR58_023186 [Nymphon striatum]
MQSSAFFVNTNFSNCVTSYIKNRNIITQKLVNADEQMYEEKLGEPRKELLTQKYTLKALSNLSMMLLKQNNNILNLISRLRYLREILLPRFMVMFYNMAAMLRNRNQSRESLQDDPFSKKACKCHRAFSRAAIPRGGGNYVLTSVIWSPLGQGSSEVGGDRNYLGRNLRSSSNYLSSHLTKKYNGLCSTPFVKGFDDLSHSRSVNTIKVLVVDTDQEAVMDR